MDALGLLLFLAYFLPAAVALGRNHHQAAAVVVLNLLLGWTVVGWIAALVWSFTAVRPRATAAEASPSPPPPRGEEPDGPAAGPRSARDPRSPGDVYEIP